MVSLITFLYIKYDVVAWAGDFEACGLVSYILRCFDSFHVVFRAFGLWMRWICVSIVNNVACQRHTTRRKHLKHISGTHSWRSQQIKIFSLWFFIRCSRMLLQKTRVALDVPLVKPRKQGGNDNLLLCAFDGNQPTSNCSIWTAHSQMHIFPKIR